MDGGNSGRMPGLFNSVQMNYGLERDPAKEPSLVEMLRVQYYSKAITAEGATSSSTRCCCRAMEP